MFYHALSKENFDKAMRIYLNNTLSSPSKLFVPRDFYSAINKAMFLEINIIDAFETWELQAGYPVVNVSRSYNDGSVNFTQEGTNDEFINQ